MLYIQRVAAISKSEKMSAQRADIASTVLKRVSARGCSIWATGRHPHAILAIPNHIWAVLRVRKCLAQDGVGTHLCGIP